MKASLDGTSPFLQLIHTSIYQRPHGSLEKFTDVSDGSSETRRTVTVNWEDVSPIRPPPWHR
jgi:hypothetical protein